MRYVLFYESAPDSMAAARENFPDHRAHWESFVADRALTGIGTFGDPQAEGSMAIFTTRDAAERFAAGDPFVTRGVVARWYVRGWNDALAT
jgi:uncharacterized protein